MDDESVVRQYLAGDSIMKLAKIYGVSRNVIRRRLSESDVPPRDYSQAGLARVAKLDEAERKKLTAKAVKTNTGTPRTEETVAKLAQAREIRQHNHFYSPVAKMVAVALRSRGLVVADNHAIGRFVVDLAVGSIAIEVLDSNRNHSTKSSGGRLRYLMNHGWSVIYIRTDYRARTPIPQSTITSVVQAVNTMRKFPRALITFCIFDRHGDKIDLGTINEATFESIPYATPNKKR